MGRHAGPRYLACVERGVVKKTRGENTQEESTPGVPVALLLTAIWMRDAHPRCFLGGPALLTPYLQNTAGAPCDKAGAGSPGSTLRSWPSKGVPCSAPWHRCVVMHRAPSDLTAVTV